MHTELGDRILIWGNSCSGKSTLAARLAEHLDLPMVELDALNWLPNWVGLNATDPERLLQRITAATAGDRWVVAGSYSEQSRQVIWPRVQTVIWLDLPRPLLLYRCLHRSWQRWRNQTLLWGTNYESFWQQLKVWEGENSLLWWVFTQHYRKRKQTLDYISDGTWNHAKVVRLDSVGAVARFLQTNDC